MIPKTRVRRGLQPGFERLGGGLDLVSLLVRVDRSLATRIRAAAAAERKSVNLYLNEQLESLLLPEEGKP